MQKTETPKSETKISNNSTLVSYLVAFLMVLAYFLFQIVSFRYAVIFALLGMGIYLYYHRFSLQGFIGEFYSIKFWILSYIGVIVMALVSVHFAFDSKATLKAIGIFLIAPLFLALMFYFVVKNLSIKALKFLLFCLGVAIFLQPLSTLYYYFTNYLAFPATNRFVGLGEVPIVIYSLFLILAFALSLAMMVYLRGKLRVLGLLLLLMSVFAMQANGTRTLILSVIAMVLIALVLLRHRLKKGILWLVFIVVVVSMIGGYFGSSHLSERFNFKKMLDHIGIVWSYAPAEMGRFDMLCFDKSSDYQCSTYSGEKLDDRFSFEMSALNRLSLWKSALSAIMQNPFVPNGFYSRFFGENLPRVISPDSKNYPYARSKTDINITHYDHMHNMILSFIFELGIVGFLLIALNFFIILKGCIFSLSKIKTVDEKVFLGCFVIFLIGFLVSMFFDSMLSSPRTNYPFFILCGIALGLAHRNIKEENDL